MIKGNVVEWLGDLYVVAMVGRNHDGIYTATLLPFTASNSSSHPSKTWPTKFVFTNEKCRLKQCDCDEGTCVGKNEPDPEKTIDTVKVVGQNIDDFLKQRLNKLLYS